MHLLSPSLGFSNHVLPLARIVLVPDVFVAKPPPLLLIRLLSSRSSLKLCLPHRPGYASIEGEPLWSQPWSVILMTLNTRHSGGRVFVCLLIHRTGTG